MEHLVEFLTVWVGIFADQVGVFFASISSLGDLSTPAGGITLAFALGVITVSDLSEGTLAAIRHWHGNIDEQYSAIDNVTTLFAASVAKWAIPAEMLTRLTTDRDALQKLIAKCRTTSGSSSERTARNTLLKTTVGYCLTTVKTWVLSEYFADEMTIDDVHALGFFAPGETGGHHSRKEPTDVLAEVKVSVINADFIRVVIDQASNENAALVRHGWPAGVRQAVIVILASDGTTEVYRHITSKLHNKIEMPDGSRGKQFLIKAAFLLHAGDAPRFGAEPTFSMPLTTEDLAATLDRQHHEEYEMHLREVERHRQEIERIGEELKSKS
jgi:hypothetical protein